MPQLRPYQTACLDSLRRAYDAHKRRLLVSLPTGSGKTVIFSHFPSYFRMQRRLLVIAHREELLDQARDSFRKSEPGLVVEVEQAERRAGAEARVVVASVQTLGRAGSKRLAAFAPDDFDLIVVDEAHHAVAPSYRRIFDHFGLFEDDTTRMLVGFTATPYRGDHQGLGEIFEEIVYAKSLPEMIAQGYLSRIRGWQVITEVSIGSVRLRHGDFVESQLARAVDVGERNAAIVKGYRDLAHGRRAIVFCVNVEHAHSMAATFEAEGTPAAAVWGEMSKQERRGTLDSFASGELDVITNCNVLTEGFDEPRVDCIVLARPTRSKLLYVQMIGRGTRLHPDKSDLVVIDVVDNTGKHSIPRLPEVFGLPTGLALGGADALEASHQLEHLAREYPWIDVKRIRTPGEIEIAAQRVELFCTEPPPEIRPHTRLAWHSTPAGDYCLPITRQESLVVRSNLLGTWDVVLCAGAEAEMLAQLPTPGEAIARGDKFVERARPEARKVLNINARWRQQKPTLKQLSMFLRRGIPAPEGLTRGQASWIISRLIARGPVEQ